MSTPDQPESPQLTRKQMRELRNTGVTPVITGPGEAEAEDQPAPISSPEQAPAPRPVSVPDAAPAMPTPAPVQAPAPAPTAAPTVVAPLPRAAEPVVIPPAPVADSSVDLGTAPLTRRQARQQERIRTASVPVITPEVAAGVAAPQSIPIVPPAPAQAPAPSSTTDAPTRIITSVPASRPVAVATAEPVTALFAGPTAPAPALPTEDPSHPLPDHVAAPDEDDLRIFEDEGGPVAPEDVRPTVNPALGAGLLAGAAASKPVTSFDQLLQRDTATTGSSAGPSTLIVSQAPSGSPLVAPVAATGEVIVTGSWNLPEGMGSTGHAPGTTDGKEIDATLVDGELPTHSSPTPISASAAVSTAVTPDEIITPPAPEKGNKLMFTLAITAGVLAVALIGVLVFALTAGVFK